MWHVGIMRILNCGGLKGKGKEKCGRVKGIEKRDIFISAKMT